MLKNLRENLRENWRRYLDDFLSWCIMYFAIILIWIGAEYTTEGIVHKSCIDYVMCGILSGYITHGIPKK